MNLKQIKAGLAWHYKKYQGEQTITDRVKYSDAEMDARRHKRGLWAEPNPVSPCGITARRSDLKQRENVLTHVLRRSVELADPKKLHSLYSRERQEWTENGYTLPIAYI